MGNSFSPRSTNQWGTIPLIMNQSTGQQPLQLLIPGQQVWNRRVGIERCRSLDKVVKDLSTRVGTMKTVSELSSPSPLHIPVLDQPDDTVHRNQDDTHSLYSSCGGCPPQKPSVPACGHWYAPPCWECGNRPHWTLTPNNIIPVTLHGGGHLQSLWTLYLRTFVALPYYRVLN